MCKEQSMKASEIILKEIADRKLTQSQAADMCGMSRQRLWDVLSKRNPKFKTMYQIMTAMGYDLRICQKGSIPAHKSQWKMETDFIRTACEENILYDSLERILESIGYKMVLERRE